MVVAMLWQKPVICLVLAVVTTLQVDRGKASDSAVPGTGTRHGSLRFRHGARAPSRGKMSLPAFSGGGDELRDSCQYNELFDSVTVYCIH